MNKLASIQRQQAFDNTPVTTSDTDQQSKYQELQINAKKYGYIITERILEI